MALTAGARIGPFEITAPLGEGGMGIVFRARDTKLGRDVAIKVLPDAFANDPDRLARFQREAQVLASLNHPNIAHIYGLEESHHTRCIVMEFVEGETLAARLKRGPVPAGEALHIAKQTAEALEAAHEKSIVHRDLKPGNVMVMPDGHVKVLDFGLAKALESAPASADLSNSPTLSMAATGAGVILGTAAYMSPEQAKSLNADARSDVFSFGCVLYEMLTGQQAFQGETTAEVLASVLVRDPDFTLLPPGLNPKLHDLIRRCLDKNRKRRWYAAGDLRMELETVASDLHHKPETAQPVAAPRRTREKLAWTLLATATLLVIAMAVPAFLYVQGPQAPADSTMRFEVETPLSGTNFHAVISPDGKRLAAIAPERNGAIWVRTLEHLDPQILRGTEGNLASSGLFWSPDGRFIGFFSGGKLKKVDILGAPPQTLCDAPNAFGGTWSRENVILFGNANGPLLRVASGGGAVEPVTELDKSREEIAHIRPYFLPDGKHFLFIARSARLENTTIFVGSVESRERKQLLISGSMPVFAPPRHFMFLRQNALMAQEFDLDRLELVGDPSPVAEQVAGFENVGLGAFSVSENGILAYRTGTFATGGRQLSTVDRMGQQVALFGTPANYQHPVLSPDQQLVAFNRADQNNDIWIMDMNRGTTQRFTFDLGIDDFPIWSPDGRRIVFSSNRDGGVFNLYEKQAGGAGQEQLLLKTAQTKSPTDWSRDGRYIIYEETVSKTGVDLWILPMSGEKKPSEYVRTPFNETRARFSPDGRWIAYVSDESGRNEVYVQSFPPTGGKWQISTDGGSQPQWRADGKELFYLSPAADDQFMAVDINARPSDAVFKAGGPKKLFVINVLTGAATGGRPAQRNSFDVMKDGQRFFLNLGSGGAAAPNARSSITVVLNWPSALKK